MYKLFISKLENKDNLIKEIEKKYHIKYDIFYNKKGKPYLKDNSYYINISHSKEYIIIAISDKEIGIDIEKISCKKRIVNKIKHNNELDIKNDIDFTNLWIKKESYLKKTGNGLSFGLNKVDTTKIKYDIYKVDDYLIAICN